MCKVHRRVALFTTECRIRHTVELLFAETPAGVFLSQYFQKTARCRARQDTKTNENLIESNTMPDKHENANRICIC